MSKKVKEKSRECHNYNPQPFPDTKRKRKSIKPNKHKSNKRTKSTFKFLLFIVSLQKFLYFGKQCYPLTDTAFLGSRIWVCTAETGLPLIVPLLLQCSFGGYFQLILVFLYPVWLSYTTLDTTSGDKQHGTLLLMRDIYLRLKIIISVGQIQLLSPKEYIQHTLCSSSSECLNAPL